MSQNDYHLDKDGNLRPGLGADEPNKAQKAAAAEASRRAMEKLREELKAAGKELTQKEETLAEREAELERREQELREREAAVLEAASGGGRRNR